MEASAAAAWRTNSASGPSPQIFSGSALPMRFHVSKRGLIPFSSLSRPTNSAKPPSPAPWPGSGSRKFGLTWICSASKPAARNFSRKARQCDVRIHLLGVGADRSVNAEHRRGHGRDRPAAAIAPMHDSRQGQSADALLARPAIAEQGRGRADQAIIVQGLNDRRPGLAGRRINRRGEQRKCIVEMNDLGAMARVRRPISAAAPRFQTVAAASFSFPADWISSLWTA